jgi:hypothetical protein
MDRLNTIENHVAGKQRVSSVYVPPLQLTEGQPRQKKGLSITRSGDAWPPDESG